MKKLILLVVVVLVLIFIGSMVGDKNDAMVKNFDIHPIEHATFVMNWGDTNIYVDPVGGVEKFAAEGPARIVLVTDIHGDHFSTSTLEAVAESAELLVVPQVLEEKLPDSVVIKSQVLSNGNSIDFDGFKITAIPMYNIPESDDAYHTKGRGNGYVVEKDGFRVYIAGDTSGTPEMRVLDSIDVAFIPMNLPYTMTVEEAADAVLEFKPKQVWPYHYRSQDGLSDVEKFKEIVNNANPDIEVVLGDWY